MNLTTAEMFRLSCGPRMRVKRSASFISLLLLGGKAARQRIETQSNHFNRSALIISFPKNPRRRWSRKSHDNAPTTAGGRN
jgi:hypothetical protein